MRVTTPIIGETTKGKPPAAQASKGINNTLIWRSIVSMRLLVHQMLPTYVAKRACCDGLVLLTRNIIIKRCRDGLLNEPEAMKFVSENTTVPVPKVYSAFVKKGRTYIIMERIRGQPLNRIWKHLSVEEQDHIMDQLRQMMTNLRSIEPPIPGCVGSVSYGPLNDWRLPRSERGPFDSVPSFQRYIHHGLNETWKNLDADKEQLLEFIAKDAPTRFSHCDLNGSNIMVSDSNIALIDWELAGWFPEHWEYVIASQETVHGWENQASRFLDPFHFELSMDKLRRKVFPNPHF